MGKHKKPDLVKLRVSKRLYLTVEEKREFERIAKKLGLPNMGIPWW